VSSGHRRASGLLLPVEIRANVSAPLAACLASEPGLQIGQPNIIGPSVAADGCPMAAVIIGAIDQETANAGGAHFSEDDLLLAAKGRHAGMKARPERGVQSLYSLGLACSRSTADRGVRPKNKSVPESCLRQRAARVPGNMIEAASIRECVFMKAAADSKRVLVTVPREVRQWLEERARYNGATLSAEVVRSIRERMERAAAAVE
jgi:hypothetical protein